MSLSKSPLWRFVRRHKPSALYANPKDIPEHLLSRSGYDRFFVAGCCVFLCKDVPEGKFWPVPGEHARILAEAYRTYVKLSGLAKVICRELG